MSIEIRIGMLGKVVLVWVYLWVKNKNVYRNTNRNCKQGCLGFRYWKDSSTFLDLELGMCGRIFRFGTWNEWKDSSTFLDLELGMSGRIVLHS